MVLNKIFQDFGRLRGRSYRGLAAEVPIGVTTLLTEADGLPITTAVLSVPELLTVLILAAEGELTRKESDNSRLENN